MLIFLGGKIRQEPQIPAWSHRGWIWTLAALLCRRQMTQGLLSPSGGIITNPRHHGFVTSWESGTELTWTRQ